MNRQIIQEAAEWFVEINTDTPDLATRKQFDDWLRASPEHVRAYLEVLPVWEDGANLPLDASMTPQQLLAQAQQASNVVHLQSATPQRSESQSESTTARKYFRPALAASLVAAVVGAVTLWGYQTVRYPIYATAVGEQRSLLLADNSTIELNSLSKVRVRYSATERAVEILNGQALFQVAKNTQRPFAVYSGDTKVVAVGTLFDVYRKSAGTVVTVVEGRVAVTSIAGVKPPVTDAGGATQDRNERTVTSIAAQPVDWQDGILLAAGDQLTVSQETMRLEEHADLAGATAWRQRQLVFDATSLADVAEEFNRYNTRRLTIDAARIGNFRISGIFSSTDPSSLIRFLREQPGINIVESENEIVVSGG